MLNAQQEINRDILRRLYEERYIETIYNTPYKKHQREGWTLKNGMWSPWYLNLRSIGASPMLVWDIACAMNRMIKEKAPDLTQNVGIEMAGIPLVSVIGTAIGIGCDLIPYSFIRPIPGIEKPRTPEQALEALARLTDFEYGRKELVELDFCVLRVKSQSLPNRKIFLF